PPLEMLTKNSGTKMLHPTSRKPSRRQCLIFLAPLPTAKFKFSSTANSSQPLLHLRTFSPVGSTQGFGVRSSLSAHLTLVKSTLTLLLSSLLFSHLHQPPI